MNAELTGVILAGGRSSRFGSDKALASWRGGSLIESILEDLSPLFNETLIVTKNTAAFRSLSFPGVRLISDRGPGFHPLMGLSAGLAAAGGKTCFVAACDMPFIRPELVAALWAASPGFDAVFPVWRDHPQPLCALYTANCREAVELLLGRKGSRLRDVSDILHTRFLSEEQWSSADASGISFTDIDTPQDYRAARELDHAYRPL